MNTPDGTIGFYDENAEDFFQRTAEIDMADQRARLAALMPPGGRLLDAGCGSGRDALAFHQMGFQVTAMEAAPKLAELARRHTGLPVEVRTFQEIAWRETFDGIWACASLLHVPRAELTTAVRRLRDALVPGGALYMSFKHGTEEREAVGRRFTDLDEAGLDRLLAEVGGLELLSAARSNSRKPDVVEDWLTVYCRRSREM